MKPDKTSRAGAVMIRKKRPFDVEAVSDMTAALEEMAQSHELSTDYDSVEPSEVTGTYDWKAYLHEEMAEARRRHGERTKDREPAKKPTVQKAPPSIFYA